MKKKNIEIRNKIINLIMRRGKKSVGEKILNKSIKEIQKNSNAQSKELLQLAIIHSIPAFKLHKMSNKKQKKRNKKVKEIPAFIPQLVSRTSQGIKFLITGIKNKKINTCHKKFKEEILQGAQQKGSAVNLKNDLQKQALLNRHYFSFYRWR
jgi:ribosomal protein S7